MVHIYGTWRLLLAFPESDLAVVIDVGEHLANDANRDIYARHYEVVGMTPPDEPRTKPACCDDADRPPLLPAVLGRDGGGQGDEPGPAGAGQRAVAGRLELMGL